MTQASPAIVQALRALASGETLGEDLTGQAIAQVMRGEATPAQIAGFLMGLRVRGETAEELAGAVRALRAAMVPVPIVHDSTIDTCGTGGGRVTTFNVSTAAAFVAVGAGARVAKHGNRSFTSRCGSADVLEALGVPLSYPADVAGRLLDQAGFTFLFAPTFHPAMRFAGPVRRELAAPTLFNVVGPLANPAGVRRQVVGVADQHRGPVLAETLGRLGAEHAMVVHGTIGMDEISPVGVTDVWEVRDGVVARWTIDPADHGFGSSGLDRLAGGDPGENAARLERLLAAPAQDPIGRAAAILNAGAALYVAGLTATYEEGVVLGAGALDSGAAARALSRYREAAVNTGA